MPAWISLQTKYQIRIACHSQSVRKPRAFLSPPSSVPAITTRASNGTHLQQVANAQHLRCNPLTPWRHGNVLCGRAPSSTFQQASMCVSHSLPTKRWTSTAEPLFLHRSIQAFTPLSQCSLVVSCSFRHFLLLFPLPLHVVSQFSVQSIDREPAGV